jgi:8-oxoguanine deaminase
VLGRDDIGRIAPGTCADIVAFPLNRLSCAGAVADPLGALLMSGTDPYAAMTMVNGIVRVLNGAFVDIDESAVIGNLNAAASRMLQQAIEHTGIRFDQQPPAP